MHFNKSKGTPGGNMIQSYMERQLTSLHHASVPSVTNYKDKVIAFLTGALVIILLPYIHIGIIYLKLWVPDKKRVFKNNCSCSCFDTVFRGEYEQPGKTMYKHVYFNATWQTLCIWFLTVIFILLAYESIKYLIPLARRRNLRISMFILYVINIYPHYYSWWSYFSYYNEDFYSYYKHHMLFTVTELMSSAVVLNLCDIRNEFISWKILTLVSINIMHVLVGGMDQFIHEVIYGHGARFHKARNIGLMVPDILHVVVPLWAFHKYLVRKELQWKDIFYKEELLMCIVFISIATLMGRLL
ncbi:hypothetical protein CHS0354_034452 [Potamilus streckersoni]|nr:hypothetical protein CHS0354_034452 [Potamilus streckersoni]